MKKIIIIENKSQNYNHYIPVIIYFLLSPIKPYTFDKKQSFTYQKN